jgi:hypothetical protein
MALAPLTLDRHTMRLSATFSDGSYINTSYELDIARP